MNGVECPKGMGSHERFSGAQNVGSNLNQRPVWAVRRHTLQYVRQSRGLECAFRHTPPQRASQFHREDR